jgi:DNA-binding response OmpR family regulator
MRVIDLWRTVHDRVRRPGRPSLVDRPRVLVVEGSPGACGAIGAVLSQQFGVRVSCREGARDPAELVRRERPDVVLLDGDGSAAIGADLARRLRAEPGTAATSVVALTPATWAQAERFLAEADEDDPSAPFDVVAAVATVRSYLPPPSRPARAPAVGARVL